jgi:HlyD family secretion protein
VKTIVHPTGGVLEQVLVHDGDRVRQGQVLMRFDTSVSGVGASQASEGLDQLLARRARLEALREGRASLVFSPELARRTDPIAIDLMARERRLFALKVSEQRGALSLLGERIKQYQEQISSYRAQIAASRREEVLIQPELEGIRRLYERKLVTITRLNQLERTAVELEGQRAALEANVAEAGARISETREQMLNIAQTARADAGTELAQVVALIADQQVRRATTSDTFARSVIRAPQEGVIDKLAYTTVGSAIPAGQPILQIVPDRDRMVIEGRIQPNDVDQLAVGQKARISFSSLNRQVTPEVIGRLAFVSAEPIEDTRTGQSYFRIRVELDRGVLARDIKVQLVPGMPVEIFVQTGTRSILSFLTKPARDQLSHAMREE